MYIWRTARRAQHLPDICPILERWLPFAGTGADIIFHLNIFSACTDKISMTSPKSSQRLSFLALVLCLLISPGVCIAQAKADSTENNLSQILRLERTQI